ncbi:MAG: hypothetical protein K2L95_01765 [Alphaproteobacteria bacterium]|nr:hypothetical protein [Alphaproteobacteria bacterium]MDE6570929.1 hypothetical protein [Alphaproteobacteria bacterium]
MAEKLTRTHALRTYQCDRYGHVRPLILMNELQALADDHAEMLGCGRSYCMAHDVAWVVTHYYVDIIEMPNESEELTFTTWPSVQDALRATRDFEIRGADGRLMVRATSQWILIDMARRRPLKLGDYLPHWDVVTARAWDRTFERHPDFVAEKSHVMKCRYDDVDVNQHINNAVYAVWATESVGFAFRNQHQLQRIELNFKKEIRPDQPQVTIDVAMDEMVSRHKILTDGIEHATVVCYWKPNE